MSKWTAEDYAEQIGEFRRQLFGSIRRMAISLTSGGIWQAVGHLLFDGVKETREIELWPGIGFFARPPRGSESAEAIVVNAGGQNNSAIIATRDEATRQLVDDVADDEAAMFNTLARVHVQDDGTIEARTHAGTAKRLATVEDLEALRDKIIAWIPVASDGGAALKTALTALFGTAPNFEWPDGTTKLKGE